MVAPRLERPSRICRRYRRAVTAVLYLAASPAALDDLDRRWPGIRFRVIDEQDRTRAHMRFFVNGRAVFDLATPLHDTDELCLVQALSGG